MERNVNANRLIVVVGPNASGKSRMAIRLAQRHNGEVVSADSRQVYKGLNIGSGKVTKREMAGVRHHLLGVASPSRAFTVAKYQALARRAIYDIWRRGKLAVLCGGTGFYIDAVINGTSLPEVKPNPGLRRKLGRKTADELYRLLQKKDPQRARSIDKYNPRRLIRALEIAQVKGAVPQAPASPLPANILVIGIAKPKTALQRLIAQRLKKRLKLGLVAEVRRLHRRGLSWPRLESFGLEYRAVARYLQGKITQPELEQSILRESWQYARRQMTWFKRMRSVKWTNTPAAGLGLAHIFMKKK